jgi:hypothetical protein
MAIYYSSNIDPIQIEGVSFGEVTIKLSVTKPSITVKTPPYISNVTSVRKAYISVDSHEPVILNNFKTISVLDSAEVTLQLKTKSITA